MPNKKENKPTAGEFGFSVRRDMERGHAVVSYGGAEYRWFLHTGTPLLINPDNHLTDEQYDSMKRQAAAVLHDMEIRRKETKTGNE